MELTISSFFSLLLSLFSFIYRSALYLIEYYDIFTLSNNYFFINKSVTWINLQIVFTILYWQSVTINNLMHE